MTRYRTSTPRAAFGLAAALLTALTFGVGVVAPSAVPGQHAPVISAATEVEILPSRIDVIGVRPSAVADARQPTSAQRERS